MLEGKFVRYFLENLTKLSVFCFCVSFSFAVFLGKTSELKIDKVDLFLFYPKIFGLVILIIGIILKIILDSKENKKDFLDKKLDETPYQWYLNSTIFFRLMIIFQSFVLFSLLGLLGWMVGGFFLI